MHIERPLASNRVDALRKNAKCNHTHNVGCAISNLLTELLIAE